MGRVLKKLKEIQTTPSIILLERYRHIVGVQTIREYMAASEDRDLNVEVRLTQEEIIRRMSGPIQEKPKKE